jgi:hypothetical protein
MSQNRLREQAVLIRLFLREQNHISRPRAFLQSVALGSVSAKEAEVLIADLPAI